jgi:hypothetical protein
MTIDQLPLDQLSSDQIAIDVLAADVRAADAAVPDPPPGSGTAAVPPVPTRETGFVPWPQSRRWAEARVVPLAPAVVATAWLTALTRHDWTTVWSTTDPNLRLALAQQWLDGLDRTGDNVTAWSLAAEVPHIGMWAPFAEQLFAQWSLIPGTVGRLRVRGPSDRQALATGTRADVGRELCVVEVEAGPLDRPLTMRLRDRWRIAGLGHGVLQPGWPARWIDLEDDSNSNGAVR